MIHPSPEHRRYVDQRMVQCVSKLPLRLVTRRASRVRRTGGTTIGHRANYVLIEDGQPHIYFSRWGALTIPAVVISGPEATIAYVRSLTPDDELLDVVWAEGGMTLQIDRRELRFFGGLVTEQKPYVRRPLLRALRMHWAGWDVEWARHGIADLAVSIGWDVGRVLDTEFDDPKLLHTDEPIMNESAVQSTHELKSAQSVLSVRWPGGEVVDYLLTSAMISALTLGPRLLQLVSGKPSTALPREDDPDLPREGAYLDVSGRTAWLCEHSRLDPRHLAAMARRWPGWQVDGHVEGVARQIELSGRNPAPLMVPEERAIQELVEELMRPSTDPQALYTALTQSQRFPAEHGGTITVGQGFFSADQPPLSADERRAVILRLLRAATEADAASPEG